MIYRINEGSNLDAADEKTFIGSHKLLNKWFGTMQGASKSERCYSERAFTLEDKILMGYFKK